MNTSFQDILELLRNYGIQGSKVLSNGTEMYCPAPHIAPQAWLHIIYSKISEEKLLEFEQRSPLMFPNEYKEFLLIANGINIFSDSLSIWGLRDSYKRTGEGSIQPYDLISLNAERPRGCPEEWLFFGSYSWDGSRVMFDLKDDTEPKKVYRCATGSADKIQEWSSLSKWLNSEVGRLKLIFDDKGVEYDNKAPTVLDIK